MMIATDMSPSWARNLAGVILACCLALGCQPATDKPPDGTALPSTADDDRPPVYVTTAPVTERAVRREIAAVGTLHGYERVTLAPKVEGRVAAWNFEVGDRVKPGEVLLQIETADFELAVAEAQRAVEQELARLGIEELPESSFDVDVLPGVSRAQLLLENSRKRFDRQRALVEGRAAAREMYELSETELRVSEAALKQSRMDARWSVAAVRHRQAMLAVAQLRLAECQVIAPPLVPASELAGRDYVVSKRLTAVGEIVRAVPATPVYELVVDSLLKLRAMVPERTIGVVREQQPVEVRVDAYPDQVFQATLRRINPTIDPRSRTFEIEAVVPNDDHLLRPGGFAKAEIVIDAADAALTIPPAAVVALAGVNKVFVLEGAKVREVRVELATRGQDWIEVRGDLAADAQVVTSGQSLLFDGARAIVREAAP